MQENIVLTIPDIQNVVKELAVKHEVKEVFLFGSYARGEETQNSDIDLRVEMGTLSPWSLTRFYTDLVESFDVSVDIIETDGAPEYLLEEIKKEEVLLYKFNH